MISKKTIKEFFKPTKWNIAFTIFFLLVISFFIENVYFNICSKIIFSNLFCFIFYASIYPSIILAEIAPEFISDFLFFSGIIISYYIYFCILTHIFSQKSLKQIYNLFLKYRKFVYFILAVIFLAGVILAWQDIMLKKEVKQFEEMCRGKILCEVNIKTNEVKIQINEVGKMPVFYNTNKEGKACIPFDEGKTYQITVNYKNSKKDITLKYNGFGYLIIEINQNKNSVERIFFGAKIKNNPI